jgi:hypothetical protein
VLASHDLGAEKVPLKVGGKLITSWAPFKEKPCPSILRKFMEKYK